MARKRTKVWRDLEGRWRSPSGAFAKKPVRKPAESVAKKKPAKPGPKMSARGDSSPRRPPTSVPPPPASKKSLKKPPRRAPEPVITNPFAAFYASRVRAAQAAPPTATELRRRAAEAAAELPHVEAVTAAARARADSAAKALATDPFFSPENPRLRPGDLEAFQKTAETARKQADTLDLAVDDKKREIVAAFQASLAEQREAIARRRARRRGQRVPELEGLVVGQPPPREIDVGVRDGTRDPDKPLTAWEVRKMKARMLGATEAQATGKYQKGDVTRAELRAIEVTLDQMRRKRGRSGWRWTKRAEELRKKVMRKGFRTASQMADYFESLGFQRHDGYVIFFRDSPGGAGD